MDPQISIILTDDHKLIRASWKSLLENNPAFRVVADCRNTDPVAEYVQRHRPDILLVDISLHPEDGYTVVTNVLAKHPDMKIVGLSVNNNPKFAKRMMALGAKGYLTKTSSLEEITTGITEVHKGNIYICEEVRDHLPPHS